MQSPDTLGITQNKRHVPTFPASHPRCRISLLPAMPILVVFWTTSASARCQWGGGGEHTIMGGSTSTDPPQLSNEEPKYPQNQRNESQTWAREDVTECMAANQDRADGWSGQRSTTVCLVSGECSSSCLKEEIRKIKTALTSLLSPDGCLDFYTAKSLMNKFLLNTENMLAALSRRYSLTDVPSELVSFFFFFLKQAFQVLALTDARLSHPLENWLDGNKSLSNLSWS